VKLRRTLWQPGGNRRLALQRQAIRGARHAAPGRAVPLTRPHSPLRTSNCTVVAGGCGLVMATGCRLRLRGADSGAPGDVHHGLCLQLPQRLFHMQATCFWPKLAN